jgi:hypothetical protein
MATSVLVHGGWHGARCWDTVAAGLTGLGERAAELLR